MISYNSGSKETVLQLQDRLNTAGFKTWIDVENMGTYYYNYYNYNYNNNNYYYCHGITFNGYTGAVETRSGPIWFLSGPEWTPNYEGLETPLSLSVLRLLSDDNSHGQ